MNGLPDKFQLSAGKEEMTFSDKGIITALWRLALLLLVAGYARFHVVYKGSHQ